MLAGRDEGERQDGEQGDMPDDSNADAGDLRPVHQRRSGAAVLTKATLPQSGAVDLAHHLHDPAVIEALVGAQEDARPAFGAARRGDLLEPRAKPAFGHRRIVDEDVAGGIDRDRHRLCILLERRRLALRQIDLDAGGEQGRGDHEDDQQHQHHVDHRRDVDLRHRRPPPAPAAAEDGAHRHLVLPSISRGGGPSEGRWRGLLGKDRPSTALRAVPLPCKGRGGSHPSVSSSRDSVPWKPSAKRWRRASMRLMP